MDRNLKIISKTPPNQMIDPVEHCKSMIKEVDKMLSDISSPNQKSLPSARYQKMLPTNFLNAVETLSNRVKSYKSHDVKRFPMPCIKNYEKIGPGYYNTEKPSSPVFQTTKKSKSSSFKSGFSSSPSSKTPNFVKKNKNLSIRENFSIKHNLKVADSLQKRHLTYQQVLKHKNETFISKNNRVLRSKIKKLESFCRLSASFLAVISVGFKIKSLIDYRKVKPIKKLRTRSRYLLRWLANLLLIAGKIQRKLRMLRKRLISKKINVLVQPFQKFLTKTRSFMVFVLTDSFHLSFWTLVLNKWIVFIKKIQKNFRNFLKVQKTRVSVVLKYFKDTKFSQSKYWEGLMDDQRFDLVKKFLNKFLREMVRRKSSRAKTYKHQGFTFICESEHFEEKRKKLSKNLNLFSQRERIFRSLETFCMNAEEKYPLRKVNTLRNSRMKKERRYQQGQLY